MPLFVDSRQNVAGLCTCQRLLAKSAHRPAELPPEALQEFRLPNDSESRGLIRRALWQYCRSPGNQQRPGFSPDMRS
jgi:hypothetical protein